MVHSASSPKVVLALYDPANMFRARTCSGHVPEGAGGVRLRRSADGLQGTNLGPSAGMDEEREFQRKISKELSMAMMGRVCLLMEEFKELKIPDF